MPKLTALVLSSFLLSLAAMAQSSQISGKITDTAEKKNLVNSSILLLRKSDSILIRHTRADAGGAFKLTKVPRGNYLILVTYPNYADYIDTLEVKDSVGTIELPMIGLVLKSKLLEAVVVNGSKGGMKIKGDTTEFTADSFKVQQGATVEDLLKRLPGIQVDRNGQITAEGQTVKKVLVDGEEFFGDDPTLVTQNLRADMVDRVQVFDKKSDQAAFTGIDDGVRDKTINLKLKDSKKNGYFGRATAGAGTDGYYDEELMANYFRKKAKLAAYGILSNTGKTGLNWQERDTYGQSFANGLDVDENTGSISFSGPPNDDLDTWDGQYSGQGFPQVKTGGLHFNNKWSDDAQSVNGNYKYMDMSINGVSSTNSQYILPDTFYYNNNSQHFKRNIIRQNASGTYEWKIDSTSSIKLMADGGNDHKVNSEIDSSQALASDSSLVNNSIRTLNTASDKSGFNSNLLWRKKLGKVGRTLSLNVRENYSNNTESGYLYSNTAFYNAGSIYQDSLVDQYKKYLTTDILVDARLVYTEPIAKGMFLGVDYENMVDNTHSDRNSFNKANSGKYNALDSQYSNNYQFNVLSNRGGLAYTWVKKKFRFSAANDIALSRYEQRDLVADTATRRNFVNWYPNASLNINFAAQTRLYIRYNGNTTNPTLQQLQPIASNENPLNVLLGNPGLKPSFTNSFNLFYNSYHVLTEQSLNGSLGYSFTGNAISSSLNISDTTGKQTTQSVNVHGNYNVRGNIGFGFKWKEPDLHFYFNANANESNNVTMVNGIDNDTKSGNYTFGAGLYKSKEKKYDLFLNGNVTYTTSKSSIDPGLVTHYFIYSIEPGADVYLPWHVQVHGDANLNIRQKTPVFNTNNNVFLVNGWVGKKMLKNDQLTLKAAVNDLLNQNNGFNRNVSSSVITQNTYSTIKRYFMFSIVWNFTKAGSIAPPSNN